MHHHKWGSLRGAIALGLLAVGCPQPADLENPDAYNKSPPTGVSGAGGSAAGAQTGGTGGTSPPVCESMCINNLFTVGTSCALCHYADMPPDAPSQGKLDLSVGYTARMRDKPAAHVDPNFVPYPASMCPSGDLLINTAAPGESWLWKKVNGDQGTCGVRMPSTGVIKPGELTCVKAYIECVTQKAIGASGGTGGASGGTGGSGGTSGGSGGSGGT